MIKSDNDKNEYIYDLLTQDSYFILNRKLNSAVGLILGAFIVFLLDKEKYHKYNRELTSDGYFYATDMDIMIMTGLKRSQVINLKSTAVKKGFISIKKEGIPLKTYYKMNLQKINEIITINKSAVELSYERIILENKERGDISSLLNVSETTLSTLTFRDLRFICKKFKISYNGKNTKSEIIDLILEEKEKLIKNKNSKKLEEKKNNNEVEISSIQDLKNITFKNLRKMCKSLNVSYSGNDTKDNLIYKIADIKGFLLEEKKVEQIENQEIDFEALFKEFNISYTFKNQESIKKLKEKMSDKEIVLYLRETYENIKLNPDVKNIGALFSSKIAKAERQIVTETISKKRVIPEETNEELLSKLEKEKNEEIMKEFESLSSNEKLIIENQAINLCTTTEGISLEFIENLKEESIILFRSTIKPYIINVLKSTLKKDS